MRITQEGDYALRVVLYLYTCGQGQRVEAKAISMHENIPPRFLLKLLRKLTVAGITCSYMGYGGGYAVERPPEEITVRGVIEAIEGPIYVNRCLEADDLCNAGRAKTCVIHRALSTVQQNLLAELEAIDFSTILSYADESARQQQ
jgi:Rrf2 family transcriptional regulator, iron-sulfur cluster assembly transcription factor